MDHLVKRLIYTVLGLVICGIGIGIFIYSGLGVDPTSVFQLGLAKQLGVTYGTASALMNVVIIIGILFIDRRYVHIATFLAIFLIGYSADLTHWVLLQTLPDSLNLWANIIFALIGTFVMSLGIPIYTVADLGVGAVDLVSEIITDNSRFPYRVVRTFVDSTFVILGVILGGTLGLGTLMAVFLTGPIVQFFRPKVRKIYHGEGSENDA